MGSEVKTRPTAVHLDGDDAADPSVNVGAKLYALRKERGWTLQEAARATTVSASTLSKVERNELSPTIATIQRISRGFGIDLLSLLSEAEDAPMLALSGRRSISRAGSGSAHSTGTCDNTLLCTDLKHKRMVPIHTKVVARSVDEYKAWPKNDADIFVYVLKGTVVIHSQIYEPLSLSAGDSIYYDASGGYVWTSEGPEPAEVIWIISN